MADPITQKDAALEGRASPNEVGRENIFIRTMKSDLEKLSGATVIKEEKKPESIPFIPLGSISQESQVPISQAPTPSIKTEQKHVSPTIGPPILVIPPKEIAEIPTRPLFKTTPTWLKISGIGLGTILLVLLGLYGYWKIFIQSQPITPTPTATPTQPTFPITPTATTTAPIKFFNKLPHNEVVIDIPSKTPAVLINALKSETAIEEAPSSVKLIKITFQEKLITTEEFFNLMSIFAPQNFLLNYENDFALAFFSQKEGVRPILILKIKNKNIAESQMTEWENKTFVSDIFPLFLNDNQLPKNLGVFKSYLFIDQPVRYLNINLPFTSLNYAIYNNFLIFTTSSAGMFVILQDLTGKNISFDYINSLEASINRFVR